jgi:hypothetical protein
MAVYVDDMRASFGNMTMCHMVADSRGELLAMADRIGVQRKWIQRAGTAHEHFDICLSKRALAVKNGAKKISMYELGLILGGKEGRMPEHFTRNTVSAAFWCAKCQSQTQHRIDDRRKGPCLECIVRLEKQHSAPKCEAERQGMLLFEEAV